MGSPNPVLDLRLPNSPPAGPRIPGSAFASNLDTFAEHETVVAPDCDSQPVFAKAQNGLARSNTLATFSQCPIVVVHEWNPIQTAGD